MEKITFKNENELLTIFPSGRIDSSNAAETEEEIESIRTGNPHSNLVIDADNIEYLSSAGLRILLRLRKEEPELKLINASSDLYSVLEMTGFTEMIPVEKAYRKLSVDGCEIIGRGAKGIVYRYDPETIIKVYINPDSLPDIQQERELARRAFVLGIPTAISYDIVRVGNSYGSVFELLNSKSFSQLIVDEPEKFSEYIKNYTDLLKTIHKTAVKASEMYNIKDSIYSWCDMIKPQIPSEQAEKLYALVDAVPEKLYMLHCDYHTNNVMMQNGETLLIDMDKLSYGHPIFELANIYITYVGFGEVDPTVVENFIGFPYELACKIWNEFFPLYLETNDPARIEEVENKVKLISYVRLMRHTLRREVSTDIDRKTVELCKKRIGELLEIVDTLEF